MATGRGVWRIEVASKLDFMIMMLIKDEGVLGGGGRGVVGHTVFFRSMLIGHIFRRRHYVSTALSMVSIIKIDGNILLHLRFSSTLLYLVVLTAQTPKSDAPRA